MNQCLEKLGYGDCDASCGIDQFRLNSSLRISADEQVEFLKAFYQVRLPVSKRSLDIVEDIITPEQTDSYKLSGKTGGGQAGGRGARLVCLLPGDEGRRLLLRPQPRGSKLRPSVTNASIWRSGFWRGWNIAEFRAGRCAKVIHLLSH